MKTLLILPILFLACGCSLSQRMDTMNQKLDEMSAKLDESNRLLASVELAFADIDPAAHQETWQMPVAPYNRPAEELVLASRSVTTRLEMRGEAFGFHLAGSVFRVVPWLVSDLTRRLAEVAPRSVVSLLNVEPAMGAVLLALAEARGGAQIPRYKS